MKTLIFSFFRSPFRRKTSSEASSEENNVNEADMNIENIDLSFIDLRDILNLGEHSQSTDPNQILQQQPHQA